MAKKKERKFRPRFDGNRQLLKGGRKKDSNYYRRKIKNMKMARICELLYNVEQLVIVASAVYPPFKSGLVDRLLVLALKEKVTPFVVITKTDLVQEPNLLREISAVYQQVELSFYFISNITREGLNELKPVLKNNASAVIGHSGVGKTALLNNLDASFNEKVRPVSSFTRRGRHTTNMIRRHELSFGGTVFDMPGLKEIDFIDVCKRELGAYYTEFNRFADRCKFKNCLHLHEQECGVKDALEKGLLHPVRYKNYQQIIKNLPDD